MTEVFATLRFEATHSWKECPYDEVGFLRHEHRHEFRVKAYKAVSHDDRDTEFIMLKRAIADYCAERFTPQAGPMSCEMIARALVETFGLSRCEVSEDGENGAVVTA